MCWENEKEYGKTCFDFLWNDYGLFDNRCIVESLKDFNIIFNTPSDEMECKHQFFQLLSKWHYNGIIIKK